MCKGMDDSMVIEHMKLVEKRGGKSQWSALLEGVRGVYDRKPCLKLQKDRQIIEAFFEHFGTLIRNWIDGEAV